MHDKQQGQRIVTLEPVRESPQLFDLVYRRLMAAIIDASLGPGQRIVQADLAGMLGVSRAPVSHALQVLKHQGLVREAGKKGLEVAPIDPDRVGNLYQIRAALESLAARRAAQRRAEGSLPDAEADALRRVFDEGDRLSVAHPMSRRVQADIDFHRAIYRLSGNSSIGEIMEPLWPHLQRAMVLVLEASQLREQAWREHRQIIEHILSGEPAAGAAVAAAHADKAGETITSRLRRGAVGGAA